MKLINAYSVKEFFGEEYSVYPVIKKYQNNKRLEILLMLTEDEWFCDLTININQKQSNNKNKKIAFVDTKNNSWAEQFIQKNGLGKPTGFIGVSGNYTYPEYEFDLRKLNK